LQQASSSSLMAAQAAIGGKNGSASGEDADDSDGTASVSAPHSGGIVHLLADWILRGREEFVPWLSWKVYDILFALALIWLGRRVKLIRDAQEHGIL